MKRNKIFFLLLILSPWLGFQLESVVVSSAGELAAAIDNANNGGDKEIILKDGTYTLNDMLPVWANGVTVRSQSGDRDKVIIRGRGMYGSATHIFNVAGTNFTARDMTIGWVSNHAVQIWGNNNSSNTLLANLRIVDTYEQMVKISYNPSSSNSSENGTMENCLLEYSAGIGPQWYIGGIDGHQCKNWTVRNNTFKNISSPGGDVAEHAVHFWSDSEGTLVENNLIINCDRGIGFGLGDRGHSGGIIRNNMIYHSSTDHGFADVAIGLENAANAKVYNNTIYMENSYPNAIEYRFPGTSGGIIKNNLCNKAVTSRNGGSANLGNNLTNAQSGWFVNVAAGDLHLASEVSQVVDQGTAITGLTVDYDGDSRPQGGGIDIGADEYKEGNGGNGGGQAPPFGSFDTPLNGSTVRSSVALTGWALDDAGVESVKIYWTYADGGTGLIYVGDAVFIEGARPDIVSLYPGYANNHKAGWGYMILTNFLPDNGNGTFILYALAKDGSGNEVTLGSKTIICDNAHAVKPFGAIDTPGQGLTASGGNFINWGWALTPQPNSIPTNGSTINVFVDGVFLGHPTYNIYRSDIASLFPTYANKNGAVGRFYLDTTAYEDGVHTIYWTATDNAGNTDGIGSRYFTIRNTTGSMAQSAGCGAQGEKSGREFSMMPVDYSQPAGIVKGYNKNTIPQKTYPDENGIINARIKELERLEIHFFKPVSNISPLPIGSTLDAGQGVFYWQPGPGFIGCYRLAFEDAIGNKSQINIEIVPKYSRHFF